MSLTFHYSQCIVVIPMPNKGVSIKVHCVHLSCWTAHEMPRYIITFAHAQTWQISKHIAIDISHLVARLEARVVLKTMEKNKIKLTKYYNWN